MLTLLAQNRKKKRLKFGHHTHSVNNLVLAELYDIPRFILLRSPEQAITSLCVFKGGAINDCLAGYIKFHEKVINELQQPYTILDFQDVISDFNQILLQINQQIQSSIPLSEDLKRDTEKARDMARERAKKLHGEQAENRIGLPSQDREAKKDSFRYQVMRELEKNPRPMELYTQLMQLKD